MSETLHTPSGLPFVWDYSTNKGRVVASWIKLESGLELDFTFQEETMWTRFSSRLGFCSEYQTNDEAFNNRIFVMSDSSAFRQRLTLDSKLRHAVTAAFNAGVREICFKKGYFVARLSQNMREPDMAQAEIVVKALMEMRESLRALADEPDALHVKSRTLRRIYLAIYIAFTCGSIGLLVMDGIHNYVQIDWAAFWPVWARYAVCIFVPFLILMRALVGGTSYGHKIFMQFLVFGLLSGLVAVGAGVLWVNGQYDRSEPYIYRQPIISKHTTRHKNSTSYYVTVANWHDAGDTRSISVSSGEYSTMQPGMVLLLVTKEGYLNIEWISAYKAVNK